MANPEMMREIMDSPLMQGLLSNPEALQNLFASNPQMQQLMERNPELSHILNNPDLMRQAMEMASNPSAMREMMRSQDRQLSNIESLPGGFNALARMYSEVQEPMMDAAQETLQQQLQNNPFAALFNSQDNTPQPGPTAPPGTTNTTPLPNPWGPTNQSNASRPNSTSNTGGNNRTNTGPQTGGGANGSGQNNYVSQMMQMMQNNPELMSQLGGGTSSSNHLAMLQNPAYQQMLSQMMQNPEMRRVMMETMQNPAMMQNLPPSLQSMYSNNPESMSQMVRDVYSCTCSWSLIVQSCIHAALGHALSGYDIHVFVVSSLCDTPFVHDNWKSLLH
jgi:ubiquilin